MISTSQLDKLNKERDNLWRVLSVMIIPAPFVAVGIAAIIGGFSKGPLVAAFIGFGLLFTGVFLGRLRFKSIYAVKKQVYSLFQDNDVFVDPAHNKGRTVERIALEAFGGNLKEALKFVAESPELHRRERFELILSFCDYEKDYIRSCYGKDPLHVAQTHRTNPLTIARIETTLATKSRKYSKNLPVFTVAETTCTKKSRTVGVDAEPTRYYLHFGTYGSCEVDLSDHNLAYVGETYYIVTVDKKKNPILAYSKEEWTPNEAVEYLLSDCD